MTLDGRTVGTVNVEKVSEINNLAAPYFMLYIFYKRNALPLPFFERRPEQPADALSNAV